MAIGTRWGLRSTASTDVVVEDLRIPRSDCMVVPMSMVEVAQQMMPQPQWQRRAIPALGILAIWVGASKAMFDETVGYLKKRRGYLGTAGTPFGGSTETRDKQAWAQMELGEMDAWIGSGEVMLAHMQEQVEIPYPDRQSFTPHAGAHDVPPASHVRGSRASGIVDDRGTRLRQRFAARASLSRPDRRQRDGLGRPANSGSRSAWRHWENRL